MSDKTVKDIMSTGVRTVRRDTPIKEVVSLMCLYRFSGLPVVEDDNRLVGIVAEKDVLSRLFPSIEDTMQGLANFDFAEAAKDYRSLMDKKVEDLMASSVKTVSPDMPALRAAVYMAMNRFRRIPVAEGEKLVGMLSLGDVHKALFHESLTD